MSALTHTAPSRVLALDDLALPERAQSQILPITIAVSIVVHAALLMIKFIPPDAKLLENLTPPLEVVLVNSKSKSKPLKADALAQASLDGGGNTEEDRRAKSNLPAVTEDKSTSEVTLAARRVEQLEEETKRLLAQLRSTYSADPASPKEKKAQLEAKGKEETEVDLAKLEIARLEAQIAKQWEQYQKLPKRKFIGARTDEVAYAEYVDQWREKIERVGTRNFPEEARRRGIFATLLLTVSIRANGTVESVEIDRSSGYPFLDRAAKRIVEMSSPFPPFPDAIRREYDILSVTRNWSFTRSDGLVSE